MLKTLLRGGCMCTILPLDFANHDRVASDMKTAKDFANRPQSTETGRDRLYQMFSTEYVKNSKIFHGFQSCF